MDYTLEWTPMRTYLATIYKTVKRFDTVWMGGNSCGKEIFWTLDHPSATDFSLQG